MQAKEYLCRIGRCDAHINGKIAEVEALYDMVTRITPVMKQDVVFGGGSQDKMGNAVAKIADLKEEINREIDLLVDMKREASKLLDELEDPFHYKVLHKRYIQGESLKRIAVEIDRSQKWTRELHGRALQKFQRVLDAHV